MNNAKMWLVVKPTTGIPLFLSAVAIGSFAVHVAVLSNTTWVADYLAGRPLGGVKSAELSTDVKPAASLVAFKPSDTGSSVQQVTVILPDGTRTVALMELPAQSSPGTPLVIEQ